MEEFQEKDSGWTLHSIINLEVNVNRYNVLRASGFIKLPPSIESRQACVNVQNKDNQCFKWAVLSALYPAKDHVYRVSKYREHENKLNFECIEFPVSLDQIELFEENNKLPIIVFGVREDADDGDLIYILKRSTFPLGNPINLLMITDSENTHYVWIKHISRLLSKQISKKKHKVEMCNKCTRCFHDKERHAAHVKNCGNSDECQIRVPPPEKSFIKFKNHRYKLKAPFAVYADCECILKPLEPDGDANTKVYQEHEVFSIGCYVKCSYDQSHSAYDSSHEGNVSAWFARKLHGLAKKIADIYKNPVPMKPLTQDQLREFLEAKVCGICEKPFKPSDVRVHDHNHLNGEFRSAAHQDCNVNYQDTTTIPVVFHNLSGYDASLIIRDICNAFPGSVDVLPLTKEKYISFTKHFDDVDIHFRFIDSFRFMASSLDKLASYLPDYKIVKSVFRDMDPEKLALLTAKGVFPYEYISSHERLNEDRLPPIEAFYSSLYDSSITEEEYQRAQRVWTSFGCKNLYDYAEIYMKVDVLLLADVFESFRDQCMNTYKLDPAHYFTAPGLSWDAMLKYTGVTLTLLTDLEMIEFIRHSIRGGISQCSNRAATANNKYQATYDENDESKYLVYLDANNLYGWAMTQHLPLGNFQWISPDDQDFTFDIPDDSPFGYILEVDLDYPEYLHDRHNDLPFCPEHAKPDGSKEEKLLTTLRPKEKYVIHYRNLKQALRNGLQLRKIHRILKFDQSPWLKPYIDFNSSMRAAPTANEFEKNFFKLVNNSIFGKTLQNILKHLDVRLVTAWDVRYGMESYIAKPNFHSRTIFDENLVAVQLNKIEVLYDKPIYIGFSILDISKTLMYDFHYDFMLPKYGKNLKLLYTDTDSFVYEIKCEDFYADMAQNLEKFDTSNYPTNNPYGLPRVNNKVVGLFKDECDGKIMQKFVGLRSKMYAIEIEGGNFIKKAKGVKNYIVKRKIKIQDYEDCLNDEKIMSAEQCLIRSRLHKLQTIKQTKIALSPYDDKRYLIKGSTDTLAWGHYSIIDESVSEIVLSNNDDDIANSEKVFGENDIVSCENKIINCIDTLAKKLVERENCVVAINNSNSCKNIVSKDELVIEEIIEIDCPISDDNDDDDVYKIAKRSRVIYDEDDVIVKKPKLRIVDYSDDDDDDDGCIYN